MDRERIIKALECCYTDKRTCSDCPFQDPDKYMECSGLALSALELIKELTEENEAWQKQLISEKEKADKAYYELACEVENLRAENERLIEAGFDVADYAIDKKRQVKTDTVREMRERLTAFFENDETVKYVEVDAEYINEQIDRIAKEMEEGL